MNEAANPQARGLDGLIGMLSHDLRTPLSAISGWLFLLESGKLDADGQKRALAKIKASVEEQVQLIDETLLISRSQFGRLEITAEPVGIDEPLAAAVDALRPLAAAKGVTLEAAPAPQARVAGDGKLLRRAFDLLLAHALKATPAGGAIAVSASAGPDEVRIGIRDNGAGFAAAELPFVLDPFRPPPAGAKPAPRGAERGLLLAHAIFTAHRGSLAVHSEGPDRGESFAVALPASGTRQATRPAQ
jgi:signal transduction histidine kinase